MSKTMTQQSYDKILEAAKILCEYCENNACENCQVTRLTDDAYLDATEEGIIDRRSRVMPKETVSGRISLKARPFRRDT